MWLLRLWVRALTRMIVFKATSHCGSARSKFASCFLMISIQRIPHPVSHFQWIPGTLLGPASDGLVFRGSRTECARTIPPTTALSSFAQLLQRWAVREKQGGLVLLSPKSTPSYCGGRASQCSKALTQWRLQHGWRAFNGPDQWRSCCFLGSLQEVEEDCMNGVPSF